jgi:hypothetical protein
MRWVMEHQSERVQGQCFCGTVGDGPLNIFHYDFMSG